MRVRLRYGVLFVLSAAVLALVSYLAFALIFGMDIPTFPPAVEIMGFVVFGFMCLLLVRYLTLMWFSFLDQLDDPAGEFEGEGPPASIIVPAFNEGPVIRRSIESLLELDYPAYEIVVVDDGSTDETFEEASKLAGRHGNVVVRVITKANGGKSSALNMGISAAAHDYVLCMDGDSKLSRLTLRSAMTHFADPHVGAVAGNVKVINRNNLITRLQALEYVEGLNMVRRAQAFFRAVSIIPGPMGVFRRRVVMEVGGYEHDTFAEDCDLTLKILDRGWKITYEPDAIAFTEAPEDVNSLIKQRYRWTRGVLQALKKRAADFYSTRNPALTFSLWYLGFEAMIWPVFNVLAQIYLLYLALAFGTGELLLLWWVQLTTLDLVAALYCVASEEENLALVPLAIVYRLSFSIVLDICKLLASVDEIFAIEMGWGKLERRGRL